MNRKITIVFIALILSALSCNLLATEETLSDTDKLATSVAGTQTALSAQASAVLPATDPPPTLETPTLETPTEAPPETEPPPTSLPPESTITPTEAIPTTPPEPPTPVFDSSLLRVVYAAGNEVWIWTEGGSRQRLYSGELIADVRISPDGQVVVILTRGANHIANGIYRVNSDGSDLRLLLDQTTLFSLKADLDAIGAGPFQYEFVPGTHTLAFNTQLFFEGPGLIIQDDLRLLDAESGALHTLFDVGQAGSFVYSPDGSQIVLSTPETISLVNADGSNRRHNVLTFPHVITYSEYWYYPIPRWSPDGRQLRVVIPSEDPFLPDASIAVWEIPLDDSPAWQVGVYHSDVALFNSGSLLTPDLQRVAYLDRVGAPEDNTWALHIASLDGAFDNILRTGNFRFEGWSPDATWHTLEQDGDRFIGNISGGLWPLADHPPAIGMRWISPSRFLYVSGSSSNWDLRLGDFSGPSISIAAASIEFLSYDFAGGNP